MLLQPRTSCKRWHHVTCYSRDPFHGTVMHPKQWYDWYQRIGIYGIVYVREPHLEQNKGYIISQRMANWQRAWNSESTEEKKLEFLQVIMDGSKPSLFILKISLVRFVLRSLPIFIYSKMRSITSACFEGSFYFEVNCYFYRYNHNN